MQVKMRPQDGGPILALLCLSAMQLCYVWPAAGGQPAGNSVNPFERNYSSLLLQQQQPNCGYKSCPRTEPKRLNVHVIAHTHDDVGWLKTVDQYYYGTNKGYSQAGVQYILDSVVPQLLMDKSKRFIYVEMSFFTKWWDEQDEQMRSMVRYLVNEGRLEFINGGWCMNDEATVTYHSTIEQMTLGLKFLNETFGACGRPKVGWQIDPFGHSNEQASLFAQFGFDGMFFTRISYADKLARTQNRSLDLIWHGDRALQGQSGSIFTNIFRDGYDAPEGYCFDSLCRDAAIVDNKKSYEYNVETKGSQLVAFIRAYAAAKLTNHLLIPFGGDFQFTAAGQNFKSLDKLMRNVREQAPDINIFYSTPSCYQWAVHEAVARSAGSGDSNGGAGDPPVDDERGVVDLASAATHSALEHGAGLRLPEKYDDFMPYDSAPSVWWSGYFASRPSVKLVERETAQLLQVARVVSTAELIRAQHQVRADPVAWAKGLKLHEARCLEPLWEVLGDLQHHDAVTGTEKQFVANDYVRRAVGARKLCAKFLGDATRRKLDEALRRSWPERYEALKKSAKRYQLENPVYLEETVFCPLLNISQCDPLESDVDSARLGAAAGTPLNGAAAAAGERSLANQQKLIPEAQKPQPLPKELETKSVLMTAYNPLARPVSALDVRLPCNGRCDLDRVQVIRLATNETLRLVRLPVPAGVSSLPFRDAHTTYEILFYVNIPPLGSASFLVSDENLDDLVDEETYGDDSILITDETAAAAAQRVSASAQQAALGVRSRRIRAPSSDRAQHKAARYEYFEMGSSSSSSSSSLDAEPEVEFDEISQARHTRDTQAAAANSTQAPTAPLAQAHQAQSDRVIVKFDMHSGVITGLKRVSDGSVLNITQKFGYYFPADLGPRPGAYIFRPNSSEPHLLHRPVNFRMYKRQNGALIEIHQKWSDWIWQTIRVDAKKNYIEFDYVVGPIPTFASAVDSGKSTSAPSDKSPPPVGREVITRYMTNMANEGVFLTDSNGRQLMPRHRMRAPPMGAADLGGSFYPVVSTMMIRNNKPSSSNNNNNNKASKSAEAVSVLVDRAQAGTSLNEGDLELLIHRRQLRDDHFGVEEPLDEPGEDGRGLVTRGRHRLYLKFLEQPPAGNQTGNVKRANASKPRQDRPSMFQLPATPRANLAYEQRYAWLRATANTSSQHAHSAAAAAATDDFTSAGYIPDETYLVHDQLLNDIRQESIKYALKPVLTFDRLRVSASDLMQMLASGSSSSSSVANEALVARARAEPSLLNVSLPDNVHLLTLQPWLVPGAQLASATTQLLLRLENLDNPLTLHPMPDPRAYTSLLNSYKATHGNGTVNLGPDDPCLMHLLTKTEVNLEHLLRGVRITGLEELNLGANSRLADDKRLDWTQERSRDYPCDDNETLNNIALGPRQIRTFLATFETLQS